MKLLAVVSIALMLAGCMTDNRERIAMATLYPDDAPQFMDSSRSRPAPILSGALNEKFPPGTDAEQLQKYVANLDGTCHQSQSEQIMKCSFVETGGLCAGTEVNITAQITPMNKIGHIIAYRHHDYC